MDELTHEAALSYPYRAKLAHVDWNRPISEEVTGSWKKLMNSDSVVYRSYVSRQHFRLRSFASLCLDCSIIMMAAATFNWVYFLEIWLKFPN